MDFKNTIKQIAPIVRMQKLFLILSIVSLTIVSCSKDKEEPDVISLAVSEKTLFHDDEYQIEATSRAAITYTTENEYYATVSETGLVTANYVGETNILLSNGEDTKTFKVVVNPKSNLYPEPDIKFGDSKAAIIAKFGTPDVEDENGIAYADYSNTAPILMCFFDASNKLEDYSIMVKTTYTSVIVDFLGERYLAVAERDGLFMFINGLNLDTATMTIGLQVYNISYLQVIYAPNAEATQSKTITTGKYSSTFNKMLKHLLNLK